MDLSKLGFPWTANEETARVWGCEGDTVAICWINDRATLPSTFDAYRNRAKFIALAAAAFDVMMRRGWTVQPKDWSGRQRGIPRDQWRVVVKICDTAELAEFQLWCNMHPSADPFTALVEADQRMTSQGK